MHISLNGEHIQCKSSTLMDLVREKGYDPSSLVAEVNLNVISQSEWESYAIQNGDTIELLNFVGGG